MYVVVSSEDNSLGRKKHTYFGYLGFTFVYFKIFSAGNRYREIV